MIQQDRRNWPISLLAALLLATLVGCPQEDPDQTEDFDQISEVCFGTTLDLLLDAVEDTNHTAAGRRYYDREPLCWTWRQQGNEDQNAQDQIDFELSRTFSIGDDGRRFGCQFSGSGNALRGEITDGFCLLEQAGGHLRMTLDEPASIQLQDIHSTQVVLNFKFEERRQDWVLTRGRARLDMANQQSVLQGIDRGEEDLDDTGPDNDRWSNCPQMPVCFTVDLTDKGELIGDAPGEAVCQDWLDMLQYGALTHAVTEDFRLEWRREESSQYPGVRTIDGCAIDAFWGSMDTRNDYFVDLEGDQPFSMTLRGYHQAEIDGIATTRFCEARWQAPIAITSCSQSL